MNQTQAQPTENPDPPTTKDKPAVKKKATKKKSARLARPEFAKHIRYARSDGGTTVAPLDIQADHAIGNQRWAAYDTVVVVLDLNERARKAHELSGGSQSDVPEDIDPAELIKSIGPRCCFTAAEIEDRMESFKLLGQESAVKLFVSGTGIPMLAVGFLRHVAACVLDLRGVLASYPTFKGTKCTGLLATIIAAPKDQTEYAEAARRNVRENLDRKELTPVDMAIYAVQQLKAFDKEGTPRTKEEVAGELKMAVTSLPRYLQLWNDTPPARLLAVHEGRMSMSAALAANKNEGRGNTTGTQKALSVSKLRNAIARVEQRPPPANPPTRDEMVLFLRSYAGEEIADLPEDVQAWVEWAQAEKAPKAPKPGKSDKPRAAAPPRKQSEITVSGSGDA